MSKKNQRTSKGSRRGTAAGSQSRTGLYAAVSLVVLALLVAGVWLFSQRQPASAATPEEVAAEIIPQEGDATSYGIPLSLDNTQRFIDYYNATTLTSEQEDIKRKALETLRAWPRPSTWAVPAPRSGYGSADSLAWPRKWRNARCP